MTNAHLASGGKIKVQVEVEKWPLAMPFRISNHTFEILDFIVVHLERGGLIGRGEASAIYYRGDTAEAIRDQIVSFRTFIEAGLTPEGLAKLMPPGSARNAVDCALWDLESKCAMESVSELLGIDAPRPLLTAMTCGADEPQKMAAQAVKYRGARALKLKLVGDHLDHDRVRVVRNACPTVWIGVDANQSLNISSLTSLMPTLVEQRVELIEQPLPVGQESLLEGFSSPVPIAADESAQCLRNIGDLVGRFDVVNIKLDKCGGLSEGLAMMREARKVGLKCMVGNMFGTSLAMAPAYVLGQSCDIVDLDGPLFLKDDRKPPVSYSNGYITCPRELWGN